MQDIAREMNLSETAFLIGHEDGYDLRWFTPTTEVDLCGHATLASAHVLWQDGHVGETDEVVFHTRSGELRVKRLDDGWIHMDFPAQPATETEAPDDLMAALGLTKPPAWVGQNTADLLVLLQDEKVLRTLKPDFARLEAIDVRGIIVTAPAISPRFDFSSRFFAPRVGVPEDPVTGSAHCALAPFWSERLDRDALLGYQVSNRGGTVRTRVAGDRVFLGGEAVTVMRCEMVAER